MTSFAPISGFIGGVMVGLAALLLMFAIGRIAGICGIVVNAMVPDDAAGRGWRVAFVAGLPLGAVLVTAAGIKDWSAVTFPANLTMMTIAGLLVGFGATVGSGCTSGHAVCGIARFSRRSIIATATFMTTAAVAVFVVRHLV